MTDRRMEALERQVRELKRRVETLEGTGAMARPEPRLAAPAPATPRATAVRAKNTSPGAGIEDLLGGRVLAWLGSVAIVIGVVFFFGMAISRGWIDEPTRVFLGLLGSLGMVLAGVWLHESKARVEAALAAAASGIAGLFIIAVVATQVYDLMSTSTGLFAAVLTAAVAVAIAVRWDSAVVAAIGLGGALLAPVLAGADVTGDGSISFVAIALAGSVGVLVWCRWDWLALGAFMLATPQLIAWIEEVHYDRPGLALTVLAGFGAVYMVAAFGYELRARTQDRLPVSAWLLILGTTALVAGFGYDVLLDAGNDNGAVAWLLSVAAVDIVLGAAALRAPISREVGSLLTAAGLALSALGLSDALDGPALVAAWAVEAVVLAWLASGANAEQRDGGSDAVRLLGGAGAFLALAAGHTFVVEAPPNALLDGVDALGEALAAISLTAAAAAACAWFSRGIDEAFVRVGQGAAATLLVYAASVLIVDRFGVAADGTREQAGQVALSAFWTVTGVLALVWGLIKDEQRLRVAGLSLLGVAITKVYTYDLAALDELARVLSFVALGMLLLAGAFAYQRIRGVAGQRGAAR